VGVLAEQPLAQQQQQQHKLVQSCKRHSRGVSPSPGGVRCAPRRPGGFITVSPSGAAAAGRRERSTGSSSPRCADTPEHSRGLQRGRGSEVRHEQALQRHGSLLPRAGVGDRQSIGSSLTLLLGCEDDAAVSVSRQADPVARLLQHPAVELHLRVPDAALAQDHHRPVPPRPPDPLWGGQERR